MLIESTAVSAIQQRKQGLNPCSNGICSLRGFDIAVARESGSLNPCSNGICSLSSFDFKTGEAIKTS